jgi:virulence factor Mce-like protein
MQKTALSTSRLLTIAIFSLSCFGLLLFLWVSFGGSTPLKSRGYRVTVDISEAATLADQADVRISGVPVGKVVSLKRVGAKTRATIQLKPQFAPLRRDVRATLRFKTLLGETFIELTPGTRTAEPIPEGGQLPDSAVQGTTEVDEVLSTFDPRTRRALRSWLTGWSAAVRGRATDIQGSLAALEPLSREGADVLDRLDTQDRALRSLVRNAGSVFRTVGAREAESRRLVTESEKLFASTAARDDELRATLRAIPPFLRAARPGLAALEDVSRQADPVVKSLSPVAPIVRPVLRQAAQTAPELRAAVDAIGKLGRQGTTGLRALRPMLSAAGPLLDQLHPFARDLIPISRYASLYREELISSWPAIAASTQFITQRPGEKPLHYFRAILPISDENFVVHRKRSGTSRPNAYPKPRWLDRLAQGLESFDCRHASNPRTLPGTGSPPACLVQEPPRFQGSRTSFQRLERAAP